MIKEKTISKQKDIIINQIDKNLKEIIYIKDNYEHNLKGLSLNDLKNLNKQISAIWINFMYLVEI